MFYGLFISLAWIIWHIGFRIKVVGKENLIKDRGFVLCPNHISAIDPVFVGISRFWGKRMLVLAKNELFCKNFIFNWFFKQVGVVPVHRGTGDTTVVDESIEYVKNGNGLLIFPEGTRTKDGNLGHIKSGAFVVAAQAHADIIPCRIIYKGGKMRVFGHCTVVFGTPIPACKLELGEPRSGARLREVKKLYTDELDKLLLENKQYL
ncbi:MAG: lysophospholipid acyltransferase family protein [Oscillospiraceae bacterium]